MTAGKVRAIAAASLIAFGLLNAARAMADAPNEDDPGVSSQSDGTSSGAIQEDDPRWSCVDDGNRVCGPDNPEGKPAACYDDGGVIEAYWPCHVAIDPQTGDTDIFEDGNPIPVYVY